MYYEVRPLPRVLTAEQATEMVGDPVPDLEPNIKQATVATDADTGEPVFAYLPLADVRQLRAGVLSIRSYAHTPRNSTAANVSRTFGASPRSAINRREGCQASALTRDEPILAAELARYASVLQGMLAEIAPQVVDRDRERLESIDKSWRIGESDLWTSGVINRSSRLPYHRDTFNFPTWSAMPVLRRNMRGGFLSIPEYDATVACRDGWAVFFPGHDLLHGVTSMTPTARDGYRYSIVYYALRGMKDCFTAAVETEYAKRRRTEREREMAARIAAQTNQENP